MDWKAEPRQGEEKAITPSTPPATDFAADPVPFETKPVNARVKDKRGPNSMPAPDVSYPSFAGNDGLANEISPSKPGSKRVGKNDSGQNLAPPKKVKVPPRRSKVTASTEVTLSDDVAPDQSAGPGMSLEEGQDDGGEEGQDDGGEEPDVESEAPEDAEMDDVPTSEIAPRPSTEEPSKAPERKKKWEKTDARKAKEKKKKKEKTDKKRLTESLEQVSLGAGTKVSSGTSATPQPSDADSSSSLGRIDKKGRVTKPGRTDRPLYKEVSTFSRMMANGQWLLTQRCHSDDPIPDTKEVIEAWNAMSRKDNAVPRPIEFVSFGKEFAVRFASADDAFAAGGVSIQNGAPGAKEGCHLNCTYNRSSTATIYVVTKTSMMSAEQVREALRQAFPSDNFSLYKATSFGFLSRGRWPFWSRPKRRRTRLFLRARGTGRGAIGVHLWLRQGNSVISAVGYACEGRGVSKPPIHSGAPCRPPFITLCI